MDNLSNSNGDIDHSDKSDPPCPEREYHWCTGDVCLAFNEEENKYMEACIESVEDDEYAVVFFHNKHSTWLPYESIKSVNDEE